MAKKKNKNKKKQEELRRFYSVYPNDAAAVEAIQLGYGSPSAAWPGQPPKASPQLERAKHQQVLVVFHLSVPLLQPPFELKVLPDGGGGRGLQACSSDLSFYLFLLDVTTCREGAPAGALSGLPRSIHRVCGVPPTSKLSRTGCSVQGHAVEPRLCLCY